MADDKQDQTLNQEQVEKKETEEAKEKKEEKVIRTYTVNLRREWLKAPKWKRAKKAMKALKEFVLRHLKVKNVRISPILNEIIWNRGSKNPPARVKIKVVKEKEIAKVYPAK